MCRVPFATAGMAGAASEIIYSPRDLCTHLVHDMLTTSVVQWQLLNLCGS
jgi:hypothetical protein